MESTIVTQAAEDVIRLCVGVGSVALMYAYAYAAYRSMLGWDLWEKRSDSMQIAYTDKNRAPTPQASVLEAFQFLCRRDGWDHEPNRREVLQLAFLRWSYQHENAFTVAPE